MKKLTALLTSVFFSWSSAGLAQEIQDIPPGDDVIESVSKGQPAPFNGQLFDVDTAIRWANWLRQYEVQIQAVERREKGLCQSELSYERDLNEIEVKELQALNADLKDRLTRSETRRAQAEHDRDNPPWYKSPWMGVVLGVVGTATVFVVADRAF